MCEDVHFDLRSASASQYSQSVIWCGNHFLVSVVLYALHSLSLSLCGDCCFADMVLDRVTRPYRFNKLLAGSMCHYPCSVASEWHLLVSFDECFLCECFVPTDDFLATATATAVFHTGLCAMSSPTTAT